MKTDLRTKQENAIKYRAVILAMADWIDRGRPTSDDLLNTAIAYYKTQMMREI